MAIEGFEGFFNVDNASFGMALVFQQSNPEEKFHRVKLVK